MRRALTRSLMLAAVLGVGPILAQNAPQHGVHVLERGGQADYLGLEHLLPAEGEQLLGECTRSLARVQDLLQPLS